MQEIWKPVVGYEGKYLVSDKGNVFGLKYNKLLKFAYRKDGYLDVCLYIGQNRNMKKVHRLVAEAFIPNVNNLPQVNHIDFNRSNNTLQNLEWVNNTENRRHSKKFNRIPTVAGEKNPFAKLKESDIIEIRLLRKKGLTLKEIGLKFNTTLTNVSGIVNGKRWKHV